MKLLAIDPGPVDSAWVLYDTETGLPTRWAKESNALLAVTFGPWMMADGFAIEMIASYGMAVGAEVFETCVWIGRFTQKVASSQGLPMDRVFRRECKLHLCADSRAKDSNIRQALIDRYGPGKEKAIGLKASPGPLYGMSGDCWSALAVAVTFAETRLQRQAA